MKCEDCGQLFKNTLTRCPRCKTLSGRHNARLNEARLIEFPRIAKPSANSESTAADIPAWRQELNEKVRAIRARRESELPAAAVGDDRNAGHISGEWRRESAPQEATATVRARSATVENWRQPVPGYSPPVKPAATLTETAGPTANLADTPRAEPDSGHANVNQVIEKALSRVRRASENARREYLPKIEPAKTPRRAYTFDNQATARQLESRPEPVPAVPEPEPFVDFVATPAEAKPRAVLDISLADVAVHPERTERPVFTTTTPEVAKASVAIPAVTKSPATRRISPAVTDYEDLPAALPIGDIEPIDEIEPVDYLEAEMRKVDRALTRELHRDDVPGLATHVFIAAIDVVTIAVSCLPFLGLASVYGSGAAGSHPLAGVLGIAIIISFFYLTLTQALCGRTFGMMFTGTRVVDAASAQPPSFARAAVRTIGYFIAAAPFLIGFLWAAVSRQRRGWQDYLAGTRVISDL